MKMMADSNGVIALSELGRLGYTSYWTSTIARLLMNSQADIEYTVTEMSKLTSIHVEDVIFTLKELERVGVVLRDNERIKVSKREIKTWSLKTKAVLEPKIDRDRVLL